MKITKIEIKRFRSILDLRLDITEDNNFTTICGANNSGKTNVLKALNIFFNPNDYIISEDIPNHKYFGSRGGATYPEISIFFLKDNKEYKVTREFGLEKKVKNFGYKLDKETKKKSSLSDSEINTFLAQFVFFFIPSINISFPKLINSLIDDVYDLEYQKTRFRGLKQDLKSSFENYINGLVEVLNLLADEINPVFEQFNPNWSVGFVNTADVIKFKDLISEDIDFYLNDKSNRSIEGKGSGLQRLGYILLHSRIIEKLKKKTVILCVDEPDVFLHQGLQRKLKNHLEDLSKSSQVFITSHSPTFIDSYKLENVFLLDLHIGEEVTYKRTGKTFYPLSTTLVDICEENGLKKIRDYLGVTTDDFELLDNFNIILEGESDKKYITELCKYFSFEIPKIIPSHGVTKIEKYIDFYNSFYEDREFCPTILIILDNDTAGRDEFKKLFKKINANAYKNLVVKIEFIPTYEGTDVKINDVLNEKIKSNFEIEDFIYPELLVSNANKILKKKSLSIITFKTIENKLTSIAFKEKGILYNIDLAKSEKNLEKGHLIDFSSENIKQGLSGLFNLQGDKKISDEIKTLNLKYPQVKKYLERITNPKNFRK